MRSPSFNLCGLIERVIFHNQESGFCVLRVKLSEESDSVTVTGIAATVSPGEHIEAEGQFINDRQYGQQFKSEYLKITPPVNLEGIEKYLGSGMIRGIGPHFAKKLVKAFGEVVLNVIEQEPQKLLSLPGIGQIRMQRVVAGWAEQKAVREIMVFLQSHGVGSSRAVRIYKTYGNEAIAKVCENPYRLTLDVYGIGFKTADIIAQKIGIASDSLLRAQAGVKHCLEELATQGHCAAIKKELVKNASELLGIPQTLTEEAINNELSNGNLIREEVKGEEIIYLKALHEAEVGVSNNLKRLQGTEENLQPRIDIEQALSLLKETTLSPSQINALELAFKHKVLVITGGPGVGKTTLVKSILHVLSPVLSADRRQLALCAPTGRAAKRLAESTGLEAKTIHRLLEFDPKEGSFKRTEDNQLEIDLLVVDESSMIDISLMHQLLKAIPNKASLLLVGDVDQLPSVGPGTVLSDIIGSGSVPTVHLTEIFRQASSSKIIVNAHRINAGELPLDEPAVDLTDFYFIPAETADEITNKLLTVVCERIPKRFGFNPINDIQVLAPMNKGAIGTKVLNSELQKRLNANQAEQISRLGFNYACGDKVIQLVNNYDKEVFNGDIGTISSIDNEEKLLLINFDGREVEYDFHELDELSLAYAVSIHKSQGSEYKAVVIPLSTSHYPMLERNLLYTAVTRGKKLVVIIGQKKALALAVTNKRSGQRLTTLAERLKYKLRRPV